MWNRVKSFFSGGQISREESDSQLEHALRVIHEGDPAAGVGMMEDSVERTAKSAPGSSILAHVMYNAAVANLVAGDGSRAVALLKQAAEIPGTDHQSTKDRLTYLMNLGDVLTRMGELAEAEQHLRVGLTQREAFYGDDHPGLAFGLTPLAANLLAQERAAEARPLIEQAIKINWNAGQAEVAGDIALRAYIVKAEQADLPALDQWGSYPDDIKAGVVEEILRRAQDAEHARDARQALRVLEELAARLDESTPRNDRLNTLIVICNVARLAGDHEARVTAGRQALELAGETGDEEVVVNVREGLAMALDDAGREDEARDMYRQAYEQAREAGDPRLMANVLRNFGLWHSEHEHHEEAREMLKKAVDTALRADDQELYGRTLAAYGIYLQHQQEMEQAEQTLEKSVAALPLAHADRFCAMSHLLALQQGHPCPCDGEAHGQAASAIVEEIVRRSAPPGLLESISLENENVQVKLSREPSEEEVQQLNRVIELAIAELRKNAEPDKFPR